MKNTFALAVALALLAGCATSPESKMAVAPGVRAKSAADKTLFRDLLTAPGGVAFADSVLYPQARQKTLTSIQVITPYHGNNTGIERWTVQHDGQDSCSYIVTLTADRRGETTFTVQKDTRP
jgi:hypothetical protein